MGEPPKHRSLISTTTLLQFGLLAELTYSMKEPDNIIISRVISLEIVLQLLTLNFEDLLLQHLLL